MYVELTNFFSLLIDGDTINSLYIQHSSKEVEGQRKVYNWSEKSDRQRNEHFIVFSTQEISNKPWLG